MGRRWRIIPAYAGSTRLPYAGLSGRGDHPRIRGEHLRFRRMVLELVGSSPHTRGALLQYVSTVGLFRIIPAYAGSTQRRLGVEQPPQDHPRIRGEHGIDILGRRVAKGSSPHTRGAPLGDRDRRCVHGIIPAYAGSTATPSPSAASATDHPRIRGEHSIVSGAICTMSGSSPHTRGAPTAPVQAPRKTGIIPAYAGSTAYEDTAITEQRDHPRIRGEHTRATINRADPAGSSPHTRGALTGLDADGGPERIIPAYAGSTCRRIRGSAPGTDHPRIRGEHPRLGCLPDRPSRIIPAYAGSTPRIVHAEQSSADHPRIRGEHVTPLPGETLACGSSPHTRGAPQHPNALPRRSRIIPAYAGSTTASHHKRSQTRDHPRIRGEHTSGTNSSSCRDGSSPHTRGARSYAPPVECLRRIIPAYAGSTSFGRLTTTPPTDHPRIRGEHISDGSTARMRGGSSPHTRGARRLNAEHHHRIRIIPAYAGSTVKAANRSRSTKDHPRIRGEHPSTSGQIGGDAGSSPHTRGAPGLCRCRIGRRRIIPAYAGSTF